MTLFVPLDEKNWAKFYNRAVARGIKITSRYKGVVHSSANGYHYWTVQSYASGKKKWIASYPFDADGEVLASEAYTSYMNTLTARYVLTSKHPSVPYGGYIDV